MTLAFQRTSGRRSRNHDRSSAGSRDSVNADPGSSGGGNTQGRGGFFSTLLPFLLLHATPPHFLLYPFRSLQSLYKKKPPWSAMRNSILHRLVLAIGCKTATNFRHGTTITEF
ncbi:hypothetical protein VIGAN_07204200 [Vigna angularis var. angularis]|uniref:Uncharacterized protein n=1 Tax=Vigna angularis var. angularis TaxID=157739 RepID=A0A0S3SK23_PHAAN|nr:hypothetical protein VIGAN_07204200 [Vigna angularis var. angularis]